MMKFMTLFDGIFLVYSFLIVFLVDGQRYCYECTGFQCMQNPHNPDLFPGRVKCHEVMEYCATHVRYEPFVKNMTDSASHVLRGLKATDYGPTSATRSCAKVWLGNTCRRDFFGPPLITCISTCDTDFCNCDTRSPPAEMFRSGKVLHLAPKGAKYGPQNLLSCGRQLQANSRERSVRIDDDYSYYNDYEKKRQWMKRRKKSGHRRRKSRRNSSSINAVDRWMQIMHLMLGLLSISAVNLYAGSFD